ncbi:Helicase C-terminal [Penicillium fimorum]|uniref:Helicase C-terminal n=1 Tax=Penicillium fimorum TaxID=1882269 RepID=A0A9X0C0T1_9EURO|nr:Helicase C-terminal [Penicillium fimorum]
MAWRLMGLVKSCNDYNKFDAKENDTRNAAARVEFIQHFDVKLPQDTFEVRIPEFGFWHDRKETALEAYNRAWEILRYFGDLLPLQQSGTDTKLSQKFQNWGKRMASMKCMDQGLAVQQCNLPPWMQKPKDPIDPVFNIRLGQTGEDNKLHDVELKVCWDDEREFEDSGDVEHLLKTAKKNKISIPPLQAIMPENPLGFSTGEIYSVCIQRSRGSSLTLSKGDMVPLEGKFKTMKFLTVKAKLTPREAGQHEVIHLRGALKTQIPVPVRLVYCNFLF